MRRFLLLLPMAALALLLTTFLASATAVPSGHYTGNVTDGGTVAFDVSANGAQVLSFAASDVPGTVPGSGAPCTFGGAQVFPIELFELDIVADAFGPGIPDFWEVGGSFPGPDTAQGTLRLVLPPFPPSVPGCDSNTLSWSATVAAETPTPTPSPTATASPGTDGSVSPTPSPTPTPTTTATPTATPTVTPTPTATPTPAGAPQTVLTAAAAAGSTEISVADTAGFAVGDHVAVGSGATLDINTIEGTAGGGAGTITLSSPLQFDHAVGDAVLWIPAPTPTPTPEPTETPTPAATPEFTLTPKATAVPATATPKAPPPTGSGGGGGIGGLGLALALLLAAALLAGTASLIAFSFRQRE